MQPTGKGNRRILIVAEAPGADEDREGIQLVGKSGQYLIRQLHRVGIEMRKDCWLTNALICRPPGNEVPNNAVIDHCRPNLLNTIKKLNPEVIIPIGTRAVESLLGHLWHGEVDGITRWAGYRIPHQGLNAWICPTFHPSHLMRQEDNRNPVPKMLSDYHYEKIAELKDRPWEEMPEYKSRVEVIMNPTEAAVRLSQWEGRGPARMAFDFETNMLKPDTEEAKIYTCSVCWMGKETIAFPWHGRAVAASMRRLLTDRKIKKIASNDKFEDRWVRKFLGVEIQGWQYDTMLSAHALENASKNRKISSIKFQAFVHLGQEDYSTQIEPYLRTSKSASANKKNRIHEAPLRELLIYNGLDSLLEYEVAKLQHGWIHDRGEDGT